MNPMLIALWALVGWCGTPPTRGGGGAFRRRPIPSPWWRSRLVGVVAGVLGGWAFTQVFGPTPEPWTVIPAAATSVGAFVTSRFVGDVLGMAMGGGANKG